jgi:mycothiol synthase
MSELHIPGAPDIDGLRFRTYAGPGDISAMVAVMNRALDANGSGEFWTEARLRVRVTSPSSTDPLEDIVLAFVGEWLVAMSMLKWEDSNEGPRQYQTHGFVDPDWRRRGLGTALLPRHEERLREIAATHELIEPPVFTTWAAELDVGAATLVARCGYRKVRTYYHMVRPDLDGIELGPVPEGILIQPAARGDLRAVWDGMGEAFRDHFGAIDESEAAFLRWSSGPEMDPSLLLVAYDDTEVAAAVQGVIVPQENEARGYQRGWTDPIFTRRRWRRRGLASALLGRTLAGLRERGMTSAQLGVDTENPHDALSLYRRHRFEPVQTETEWHKPMTSGAPAP